LSAARNRRPSGHNLFAEKQVDELEVAHGVGLGAGDQLLAVLTEVPQREPGGVAADAGGHQLAHDLPGAGLLGAQHPRSVARLEPLDRAFNVRDPPQH
jgi:hypothetical protein